MLRTPGRVLDQPLGGGTEKVFRDDYTKHFCRDVDPYPVTMAPHFTRTPFMGHRIDGSSIFYQHAWVQRRDQNAW